MIILRSRSVAAGYVYCNWNVTGNVNQTGTAAPFCLPGIHRGMALTTRRASLSSDGSTERTTEALLIEPSLPTTKRTITRP